ncbi:MAG: thioredoxin domain-containing protein, partial [Nannocystaceae bacterium]|nr:thioredoxin domain-containing protein [Nannocystaceae bacterium]
MRHRFPLVAALIAALTPSCSPRGTTQEPSAPTTGRAEDAASLPAFDSQSADADTDAPIERFKVELGDAPIRGRADAPVTIVMYSDFECPYCLQGHQTMAALADAYRNQIRFAYKPYPLPFHAQAIYAALAVRSAQAQGKFWKFHDRLYQQEGLSPQILARYAMESGMDVEALRRDLAALEYGPEVSRDMRQARRLGVDSTPTFFVNGREMSGAQPAEAFVQVIDAELALARKWVAQGVAPTEIYAHAIADGYSRVEYTKSRRDLDPDGVFPVPVGDSPTVGPDTAPVTIIAFGDFECPYCARGHETVAEVRKQYGDKIRFAYKHSPLSFHSFAFLAARASVAAQRQGKFWAFHDALYGRRAKINEKVLLEVAKEAGLNMKMFRAQLSDLELDR